MALAQSPGWELLLLLILLGAQPWQEGEDEGKG